MRELTLNDDVSRQFISVKSNLDVYFLITDNSLLRGLVKLKNFQKSEKNSDYPDPTHPPAYPNEKKHTKKHNIKKKKKNPSWGLTTGIFLT